MLRRGSSRSPPYVIAGLILIILILGFNYWTLSSQNADLQQELERLQADIKISAVKNEQSEKKNSVLQDTVHEMNEVADKLQKQIKDEGEQLNSKQEDIKRRDYEITRLKNEISKFQDNLVTYEKQIEEKDHEIAKFLHDQSFIMSQRDDAVEAVAVRDRTINNMKRQVEQADVQKAHIQRSLEEAQNNLNRARLENEQWQQKHAQVEADYGNSKAKLEEIQRELAAVRREQAAVANPGVVPGAMNIPNVQNKVPYLEQGQLKSITRGAVGTYDRGLAGIQRQNHAVLPRQPANLPRAKPRFSVADLAHAAELKKNEPGKVNPVAPLAQNGAEGAVVMEKPAQPGVENKQPLPPPVQIKAQNDLREVLPVPPQGNELQHVDDNLDAAIDEEENVIEDLMDDQDEEGNDIKDNPPSQNKNSNNNLNEIEDHPAGDFVDTNGLNNDHMKLMNEDEGEENQGALQVPNIEAPGNGHVHDGGEVNVEDENDDNLVDTNMDERLQNLRRGGNRGL